MAVDPTDPETFEVDDTQESRTEIDVEAPEDDTAEQLTGLAPERDDPLDGVDRPRRTRPTSSSRRRVVSIDEDDYR